MVKHYLYYGGKRALCYSSKKNKMVKYFMSEKLSFWQIVLSTLAAAIGVQNRKNHEQDFQKGNIVVYIVAGVVFTAIFVLLVMLAVNIVLKNSGI